MVTVVMGPWAMTDVGGKGWLSTEWVILLTYYWTPPLLKSPFDILNPVIYMGHKYLYILLPLGEIYPQMCVSHQFFNLVLSKFLVNNHTSDYFYFQANCTVWSSAHWEDFPSSVSFRVVPERCHNAAAVCFCKMCRTISKPGCSLLFLSQQIIRHTP